MHLNINSHLKVMQLRSPSPQVTEIGDMPFAHPTYSEAIKEAALQALGRSYHL